MTERSLSGAAANARARALKPSADLGPAPRLEWIELDRLTIDPTYQRAMGKENWAHAHRILREFCWVHFQPLCVAPGKAGHFVVIDGQHRLQAARLHPLIDKLPCYIVAAPDIATQAAAFVAFNGRRIGITRLQRFWAALAAGETVATRISTLCGRAGVSIVRSAGILPPRATYATTSIERLLPLGDAAIVNGLKVLVEAQGEAANAFKGTAIVAVVRIVESEGKGLDRAALVRALEPLDLDDEIGRARIERARSGGTIDRALEMLLRRRYVARKRPA